MSRFRPRRSRSIAANVLIGIAALAIVGMLAAAAIFFANGGRWFVVATPSMGTAAPVGTLVLTTPAAVPQLSVGDIISFHPPTAKSETYTHRIAAISASGLISTKGDINGAPDPWALRPADLIGKASVVIPGLGWLIRAVPLLIIGIAVVWLVTRFVRSRQWRAAFRIVGAALTVSVAALILRPFTGLTVLQTNTTGHHANATVVSTGLLPIRVTAAHAQPLSLVDGQVGTISIPDFVAHHYYRLDTALNLDFWGWVVLILLCCIPFFAVLIFGLPPRDEHEFDDRRPVAQHDPKIVAQRQELRRLFGLELPV
jgi:signal peptidase I